MDNRQGCAVEQGEQAPERVDHAYLRLDERPTQRASALELEPVLENGAVVFDSGKFIAWPTGGDPLGRYDTQDEAQRALRDRRGVESVVAFLAWLGSSLFCALTQSVNGSARGDIAKSAEEDPGDERPSAARPKGGA